MELNRQTVRQRIAKCAICGVHNRKTDKVEMGTMDLANYPGHITGMDLQGPMSLVKQVILSIYLLLWIIVHNG